MRKVASPKGAKAKADRLFSLIVRARGACQACGKTTNLQCAHIISRRYSQTRCVEDNAFCLCAGCHMRFTDHPVEFGDFVRAWGTPYEALQTQAQLGSKVDWNVIAGLLEVRWKELAS